MKKSTIEQIDAVLPPKQGPAMQAVIREAECIGCTKCIQACPFDAIIGTAKRMHTVLKQACTGCELCVAPCPVDCIDMIEIKPQWSDEDLAERSPHWRKRYQAKQIRLQQNSYQPNQQSLRQWPIGSKTLAQKKADIKAAVARVKAKQTQKKHE